MGPPLHASAVALTPAAGVLILGPSGVGKSSLALRLMALGARLVADDGVALTVQAGALIARAPAPIAGLIEARGAGILHAEALAQAGAREPRRYTPAYINAFIEAARGAGYLVSYNHPG